MKLTSDPVTIKNDVCVYVHQLATGLGIFPGARVFLLLCHFSKFSMVLAD